MLRVIVVAGALALAAPVLASEQMALPDWLHGA